jgi:hypothetical protein
LNDGRESIKLRNAAKPTGCRDEYRGAKNDQFLSLFYAFDSFDRNGCHVHADERLDAPRERSSPSSARAFLPQPAQRRAAVDLAIVSSISSGEASRLYRRGPSCGPPFDANDFGIREELVQEWFDVLQPSAEIEEQNSDFHYW